LGSSLLRGMRNRETHAEDVLDEPLFRSALIFERKRAERSQRLFALMLLDGAQFLTSNGDSKRMPPFLLTLTRETDIVGWHVKGDALGVIFTDIDPKNAQIVRQALRMRIESGLEAKLGTEKSKTAIISIDLFPEPAEQNSSDAGKLHHANFYPEGLREDRGRKISLLIKRAIDILGSAFLLILLSPIFVAIALAIKLTSKGEIFFSQERLGHFGIHFQFLKFRSMYVNNSSHIHREFVKDFIQGKSDPAEEGRQSGRIYKIAWDPRVTPVGRFLRKTSLDELPQLWNVFTGSMSLVGPRPPLRYEFYLYDAWHRRRILEAKPGLTGLWQVNGRSRTCFDDMVRLDLRYARSWSLWLDLLILLRTPFAVFSGDGAY
jgi:lipopolysaccharide/colanic/teichoic acid biosynthesis glycosyltransferase